MLKKKGLLQEMFISARGRGGVISTNDSSSPMVVSGAVVCGLIHSHLKLLRRLLYTLLGAGFVLKDKSFPEDLAQFPGSNS